MTDPYYAEQDYAWLIGKSYSNTYHHLHFCAYNWHATKPDTPLPEQSGPPHTFDDSHD